MVMAGQGRVTLHASEYSLDDINTAIHDLERPRAPSSSRAFAEDPAAS
jgi:hypothetical protein